MYKLPSFIAAMFLLLPTLESAQDPRVDETNPLFETADRCMACHNLLVTESGEDVSIGLNWRASMMANSARDPYWQAAVRREVMDHPESREAIEGECSICHMPMARFTTRIRGEKGESFSLLPIGKGSTEADRLAADGVSCTVCHQITDENLGKKESFTGHFVIDTERPWGERQIHGPFDVDSGRVTIMRSASRFRPVEAPHIQESEVCASCHTLFTHALGPGGQVVGELPEQVPYLEWLHSDYREQKSCQSCHMLKVESEMPITSVWGLPRDGFSRHQFRGGNFFMPGVLNRYRSDLGVKALPQELTATGHQTTEHLQTESATLTIERAEVSGARLQMELAIESLAGHKLPSAYPSRRAWIHLAVEDRNGKTIFDSGAFTTRGEIAGNDNDAHPSRFEPHYTEINDAGQVQIYEAILFDQQGAVTTGLLAATTYGKDNRLLPRGFDKTTADQDIAVQGAAATDRDFTGGGDRIRYTVDLAGATGPFQVEAALWYQPIAYRWAQNLASYDAALTRRFVSYYESMSGHSALILTRTTATAR